MSYSTQMIHSQNRFQKHQDIFWKHFISNNRNSLNRLNSELRNANYDSIEAYLPEQVVNAGILKVQFRKFSANVGSSQEKINKDISSYKIPLIWLGLVCCL